MKVPTLEEFNAERREIWKKRHEHGMPKLAGVLCDACKSENNEEVEMRIVSNEETDGRSPESVKVYCPKCKMKGWKLL